MKLIQSRRRRGLAAALLSFTLSSTILSSAALARDPADATSSLAELNQGRSAFVSKGCYECHGLSARGARGVAPSLAPSGLPFAVFQDYVRRPGGQMPPYSAKLVSNSDLSAIYAYLKALPTPRAAADIPLLAPYVAKAPMAPLSVGSARPSALVQAARMSPTPAAAQTDGGARVYGQFCSACHGADRGGGVGPSLIGEGAKRTTDQIVAFVKNPPPRMPKLYPTPLTQHDLEAVAAYLHAAS